MEKKMRHQCRWLYQPGKKAEEFDKSHRPQATLFCWQTGKNLRERECSPCLIARFITVQSYMVNSLPHKQPMTAEEWANFYAGE